MLQPSYSIPVPLATNHQQPASLTDIYHIDLTTDQGPWVEALCDLANGKRFVTVMHLCDIHFPFHHQAALEVAYQLIEHVQPDIIVVGSDAADFALISSFQMDPDIADATVDVLDEFDGLWLPFIYELRTRAPHALLVYIWGNHERRIRTYLNRQAPKFRKRIMRDYIDIIRCGGAVLYLGYTDCVRMGPLLVHHGYRTGIYAAKNQLLDAGCQISMMSGHTHTPSEFETQGEDFAVKSVVSGALCLPGHYQEGERQPRRWTLGTAIGEVDLRSRDVEIKNLTFKVDTETVWTRYERQTFAARMEYQQGLVTFAEYMAQKEDEEDATV